jgi:glucokinase-like ROK family protein
MIDPDLENRERMPTKLSISPSEYELIEMIRGHGVVTKSDLVGNTPFSRSKINGCIEDLIKKEYIQESGSGEYTGGRRSRVFSINGGYGLVAGVDIGATSIDIGLTDFAGKILARCSQAASVREGPRPILSLVSEKIERLIAEHGLPASRLYGIGIGVPGPVDSGEGVVVSPPIMPGWDGFPIVHSIQERFPSARVVVDNDVNVMALGEMSAGIARGVKNLIFVKIGTGIGSGIVCKGQIYRGSNGCAGDIGHICVQKDGPICPCGNRGCLEALAAGPAIGERGVRAALEGRGPILLKYYQSNDGWLSAENVGKAAREGDPAAIEIIREGGQVIGDVLASLVNFFNPSMIVIGGGVAGIGNLLLSSIRQAVLNRSLPLSTRDLRIVFSETGSDAGVIGAVNLALDKVFQVEMNNGLG